MDRLISIFLRHTAGIPPKEVWPVIGPYMSRVSPEYTVSRPLVGGLAYD